MLQDAQTNSQRMLDKYLGIIDYSVYQAYLESGKRDRHLFDKFKINVMDALLKSGTVMVVNAPVLTHMDKLMDASQRFFDLPQETKEPYQIPENRNCAYLPYKVKKPEDYKEMYHVDFALSEIMRGRDLKRFKDIPYFQSMVKQQEIDRLHVPGFNHAIMGYIQQATLMSYAFVEVIADYFDLDKDYQDKMKRGDNTLRLLHYPRFDPNLKFEVPDVTRALAHADVCAITILPPSKQAGLQICPKDIVYNNFGTTFVPKKVLNQIQDHDWIDIPYRQNAVILNIGHELEILTNGILSGTIHRVAVVDKFKDESRYAAAFFQHVANDLLMDVWKKAVQMRGGVNYFQPGEGRQAPTIAEFVHDNDDGPYRQAIRPQGSIPVYNAS